MMTCQMPCPQCGRLIHVTVSAVFPDAWRVRPLGPHEIPARETCGCWYPMPQPPIEGQVTSDRGVIKC